MSGAAFATAAGVAVFLAAHVTVWRARPTPVPRLVLLGALGLLGMLTAGVLAARWGRGLLDTVAAVWLAGATVIAYTFVYSAVVRSVSLTLLEWLMAAPGRTLGTEALVNEYARSSRFEDRITVMEGSGLVSREGEQVAVTARGRALVRGAASLAKVLGGGLEG